MAYRIIFTNINLCNETLNDNENKVASSYFWVLWSFLSLCFSIAARKRETNPIRVFLHQFQQRCSQLEEKTWKYLKIWFSSQTSGFGSLPFFIAYPFRNRMPSSNELPHRENVDSFNNQHICSRNLKWLSCRRFLTWLFCDHSYIGGRKNIIRYAKFNFNLPKAGLTKQVDENPSLITSHECLVINL